MSFPIYARFAHPDAGYKADQERAAEHLTAGQIYTIASMAVDRSSSWLWLIEVPGIAFNTVMFEASSFRAMARQRAAHAPAEAEPQ